MDSYQRLAHKDSAPQGVCFVGLYTIELITVNCKHPLMNEPIRVSTASARFWLFELPSLGIFSELTCLNWKCMIGGIFQHLQQPKMKANFWSYGASGFTGFVNNPTCRSCDNHPSYNWGPETHTLYYEKNTISLYLSQFSTRGLERTNYRGVYAELLKQQDQSMQWLKNFSENFLNLSISELNLRCFQ